MKYNATYITVYHMRWRELELKIKSKDNTSFELPFVTTFLRLEAQTLNVVDVESTTYAIHSTGVDWLHL